jgi:hypothetical protein
MRPFSSEDEDRSTTGTFSEGSAFSNTSEQGHHEEISNGDSGGGGDPDNTDRGIELPLDEEDPSLDGERENVLFLSYLPLWLKEEGEKKNRKQRQDGM